MSLTDTLPAAVSFASATAGCSHVAGSVTCALGTLAAGASKTATIVVSADVVGAAANMARVAGGSSDPDTSNNSASTNATVVPTVSINDVTVTEGNSGTTNAAFTVSLSAGSTPQTVTVSLRDRQRHGHGRQRLRGPAGT